MSATLQQMLGNTLDAGSRPPRQFFDQMEDLHAQIEADHRTGQDISTAFVEEMFDDADDNVLMYRAMDPTFSNESIGAYVRELMGRVAKIRL